MKNLCRIRLVPEDAAGPRLHSHRYSNPVIASLPEGSRQCGKPIGGYRENLGERFLPPHLFSVGPSAPSPAMSCHRIACHHSMSSYHLVIACHHGMSSCHVILACHHVTKHVVTHVFAIGFSQFPGVNPGVRAKPVNT